MGEVCSGGGGCGFILFFLQKTQTTTKVTTYHKLYGYSAPTPKKNVTLNYMLVSHKSTPSWRFLALNTWRKFYYAPYLIGFAQKFQSQKKPGGVPIYM